MVDDHKVVNGLGKILNEWGARLNSKKNPLSSSRDDKASSQDPRSGVGLCVSQGAVQDKLRGPALWTEESAQTRMQALQLMHQEDLGSLCQSG